MLAGFDLDTVAYSLGSEIGEVYSACTNGWIDGLEKRTFRQSGDVGLVLVPTPCQSISVADGAIPHRSTDCC